MEKKSPRGIRLRCPKRSAQALTSSGRSIDADEPPRLDACFTLALESGAAEVHARCRVLHLLHTEDEQLLISLEFLSFAGVGHAYIATFIDESVALHTH